MAIDTKYVQHLNELSSDDVKLVGGKNASLGEMIRSLGEKGVRVPGGFATTAEAYRAFLRENDLEERIRGELRKLDDGSTPLEKVGTAIRRLFTKASFPQEIADSIREAYRELSSSHGMDETDVAVRSSATAEDLPSASFAGQQETFLNVRGEDDVMDACTRCYASLFTDRAISYRREQGFDHMKVALSVGVQKMVRSDVGGSGVLFTLDTDTGFPDVVVINAAWGLGENVVQGTITPDEYVVYKPLLDTDSHRPIIQRSIGAKQKKMVYTSGGSATTRNVDTSQQERDSAVLSEDEILQLARWGVIIEQHYERPMDVEWAKDGQSDELYVVQARPETVQSQKTSGTVHAYRLQEKGKRLVQGLAIGDAIAASRVQVIKSADEIDRFEEGAILVTGMTDPDWVPVMKKASGIVTDHGGRTSHAAIVSRELNVPAVVGTGDATQTLQDGREVTLSCAEGDKGYVYEGRLQYDEREIDLSELPEVQTELMMNIASPAAAFRWWRLPVRGVGLARMEFVINNIIKIHPMALAHFDQVEDPDVRRQIEQLTARYEDKSEYFVDHLARGIARIAASCHPHPAIVRMSDFKTNEYANLLGGSQFEPQEANPMLGLRGAARYYSDLYRDGFALECRAVAKARDEIGLDNIVVMIPFCRTVEEADRVLALLAEHGLKRGERGFQVYVMAEIPSNILLADRFAERFDGFSIGTNDLTQLVLGVDRDSDLLKHLYDERNEAVREMVGQLVHRAHKAGRKVGLCGQAPSDHPDFAEFLVRLGIDSISLNPDSVVGTLRTVAKTEKELEKTPRESEEMITTM
ncbi:MAG: phosphoenolpyruvate synthase [Chitinivibrionales bacterium]|nr:phosphoenolpyruvate synthase [Chitinivibrionales bacterium]